MLLYEKTIYPSHISIRKAPVNIKATDEELFMHEYQSSICATNFLRLKNVYILQDTVFDLSTFRFFAPYTHINGSFTRDEKIEKLKLFLKAKTYVCQGVWITQNWTWMYFHWLTDALTRLIALEAEVEQFPVLIPDAYKFYPYILESLDLLGYEYVLYSPLERVLVKELILPSHTASPGNYNSQFLNQLRQRFIGIVRGEPSRKIFISRSKATQRFITNEDELFALVLSFGFEVHIFEEYTLNRQVALMREATCLMGLHGAGLTNMLFMPPKGKVLEIRNKGDQHNNCYFSMSSELDHSYYYLEGEGDSEDTASVNIHIDIIQLTNLLHTISVT
jgi:capsular polysaccharide biosynthesis protein